jgi:hypothetical protein
VEEAMTGPVTGTRKKLTGGSHLLVAGHRQARALLGAGGKRAMGQILAWADLVPAASYFFCSFLFPFFCFLFYFRTFQNSSKTIQKNAKIL